MAIRKLEIRVSVDDIDANKRLDMLAAKLDKLKGVFTIRVRLVDGGAAVKLDKMAASLDKISKKVATPKVDPKGIDRASTSIDRLDAKLTRLGHKRVRPTVDVNVNSGSLRRDLGGLFGGGGGGGRAGVAGGAAEGGAGVASGLLSTLGGANNAYFGALIASLVALIASATPALGPFALGGLVGGGAAFGGLKAGNASRQQLIALQKRLRNITGHTASSNASRRNLEAQIAQFQASHGTELQLGAAGAGLGHDALSAFLGALTANQGIPGVHFLNGVMPFLRGREALSGPRGGGGQFLPGREALSGPQGTPVSFQQSFLSGMKDILAQIDRFVKQIGPGLGGMFRASLPIMKTFTLVLEDLAKLLLPALTQSMEALKPELPIIRQGFFYLSQGVADFIKDLGPGMKDSAVVFKTLMLGVKGILIALAFTIDGVAIAFRRWGHNVGVIAATAHKYWDELRRNTAVIFDSMRHEIAHEWDMIWNNTFARVGRGVQDVLNFDTKLRHGIATDFDAIRHTIAASWDSIFQTTERIVSSGYHNVVGWFDRLPRAITGALHGLGSQLFSLAKGAVTELLHGAESEGKSVLGFFKGLGSGILHALGGLFHFGSPSKTMFKYGQWIVQGLEHGIQSRMSHIRGVSGHLGGSVNSWIMESLKLAGKPMSWLPALQRLVSLESGGNPNAVNPIAVLGQHASGLWQMLPSTFFGAGGRGSVFNPVEEGIAALRYISGRYGSPFNIPGLFGGGYRGYAQGGWITEPVVGMGLHSGIKYAFGENAPAVPEYIGPHGGGGGVNFYISVQGDSNPDAAALRILQVLRKYKTRHGNLSLNLG